MAERVECVAAASPIAVILPGEELPDGSTTGPDDYGIRITSGSGAVIVIEGDARDFAGFGNELARVLNEIAAHRDGVHRWSGV
jgi:hypothetical protein